MNRNLKIEEQTYDYLGFLYRVRVAYDHTVYWETWSPEAPEMYSTHGEAIRASRVRKNPYKAVKLAHKYARAWIDTWLNPHFALETAMNQFADRYAKSRTEFPKSRQRYVEQGEFNHGATA